MSYFTSWDANLFLCLVSLGLPEDLVWDWVRKMKKKNEHSVLELAREYHCDRQKFVDMGSVEMLYFCRGDLNDPFYHFPRAISKLGSIPLLFHYHYCHVHDELEEINTDP
tara:strand:+ start:962 stop:1291 length:330 start_codon:yes stop_codon:yes gene_type:complete